MLANTREFLDSGSHSLDPGFRVLDSSLFQWNLDSRFHSLVGYLSSILDSKALDSGFREQNFPGFRILQEKVFQISESGYPCTGRSISQTFSAGERQRKEKVGGRPAKLNEKKGDRDLEREIKNKEDIFLLEEQHESFLAVVTK